MRINVSYDLDKPVSWKLECPVTCRTSLGDITVPGGFCWDGVSVPQAMRSFVPARTYYGPEALIHDWLYTERRVRRKTADRVFRELLTPTIGPFRAWQMWIVVRLWGWRHWTKA